MTRTLPGDAAWRVATPPRGTGPARRARASRACVVAVAMAVALAGCATQPPAPPSAERVRPSLQPDGLTPALADTAARVQTGSGDSADRAKLFKG